MNRLIMIAMVLVGCSNPMTTVKPPTFTPDSGPKLQPTGGACSSVIDCIGDTCMQEFGDGVEIPGGLCTEQCEWDYSLEDFTRTCGEGETCIKYAPSDESFCFLDCSSDLDCRLDGWWCLCWDYFCFEGARGTCMPDTIGYRWDR